MGLENFLPVCRKLRNHWIYKDNDYYKVWSEMLFTARYSHELKEGYYNGVKYSVGYGEFIFGRTQWSIDCNIAEGKLRRLIDKLIKENMIEVKSKTNKFTIFKIVNFSIYNDPNFDQQTVQQMTSKRPAERPAESVAITYLEDNVDQQMTSKVTSKPTSKQSTKEDRKKIEKKIDNNIYIVFNYWNESKAGINHKALSSEIEKAITNYLKKHDLDTVLKAIENLSIAFNDSQYFYNNRWNLGNFLKQPNGIQNWLEEGQEYVRYLDRVKPVVSQSSNKKEYVKRNSPIVEFD